MLAPTPDIAPEAAPAPDPYTSNVMSYADKVKTLLDQQSSPPSPTAAPTGPIPGAPPENPSQDNMTINARSGEFIFPEPATKYYGVKKLEDMVQKALEDIKPPQQPTPPPMPEARSFARGGLVGRKHFLRHVGAPHPARKVKPAKVSDIPLNAAPLPPMPAGPAPMAGPPMRPPTMAGPPMDTPMGPAIIPARRPQPQGYAYGGLVTPVARQYAPLAYRPYRPVVASPAYRPMAYRPIAGYAGGGEVRPMAEVADVPPFLAEPPPTPTPPPPIVQGGGDYHSDYYQYNRLGDWRNIPYGSWYKDRGSNKKRLKYKQVPRGILS